MICDCTAGTDKKPEVKIKILKEGVIFKCLECGAEEFKKKSS